MEKRQLLWDITNMSKYFKVVCQEEENRLFSVVPHDKGQWALSGTQKVPFEHEEKNLYFAGDRALEKASQRGCGISLETFNTHLGVILCNLLQENQVTP